MANLGIVIAVSEYTHDAKPLPACARDGAAMAEVFRLSGRFENILQIDEDTKSTSVKQRLTEFIKSHAGSEIEHIVFYFTGHGSFYDNEFYYLLSDYQQRRIRQTSLENTELDNIICSANPKLFVKIVDACHSGMTYIKSADDFTEYVKEASAAFKRLYFMFSSQSEQFSYQNNQISYFTESFLKAIANHPTASIRYKDIIDYVSDDFAILDFQTPFFVTQADFTEVFVDVSQQLKETLLKNYIQAELESSLLPQKSEKKMVDLLREDAKRFCTKEEAHAVIHYLEKYIDDGFSAHQEVPEIYEIEIIVEDTANPPASANIGRWIDKNKGERGYFARATTGIETRRVPARPSMRVFETIASAMTPQYVDEKVEVIDGFKATSEMPFNHIRIRLEPKFPNIMPEECFIVPILSRTHVRVFWAFAHFEYIDWENTRRIGSLDWSTDEAPLKDTVAKLVKTIVARFWSFVEEPLRARWGPTIAASSPEHTAIPSAEAQSPPEG